jgi:FAD:protein FMN transferase
VSSASLSSEFTALGTTALIGVTDPAALEPARAVLGEELAAIDRACSRFRADSELARVNGAGDRPVAVGPLFVSALRAALRAAELTDGDVDPTLGRALRLAGYDRDFARVAPDGPELPEPADGPAAGWRVVDLDTAAGTVRLPRGVELDLGATAKAFAADRAARRAHEAVGAGVLVSLGGDIAVAGPAPPGGWSVSVADNHADQGAAGETVAIVSGGLATSSTRVRRWRRGGRELHHVIDPRSGRPAASCWRTVSVAAGSCVDANTASTAALVRGGRATGWLAGLGLPARLVRNDGCVVRVGGWPLPEPESEQD